MVPSLFPYFELEIEVWERREELQNEDRCQQVKIQAPPSIPDIPCPSKLLTQALSFHCCPPEGGKAQAPFPATFRLGDHSTRGRASLPGAGGEQAWKVGVALPLGGAGAGCSGGFRPGSQSRAARVGSGSCGLFFRRD